MVSPHNKTNCWAIVPAAGVGQRMQADRPKQYLPLAGLTVLEQTLQRLWGSGVFEKIVVVVSLDDGYWPTLPVVEKDWIIRADGGEQRADSVLSGLRVLDSIANSSDWVFVHDAARPCITSLDIQKLKQRVENDSVGGILALPVNDTLKQTSEGCLSESRVLETVDRNLIWRAQTPQMFRLGMLKQALLEAFTSRVLVTDEASAIEALGFQPLLIEGRADNIKITRPEDLALARFYLEQQNDTSRNGL